MYKSRLIYLKESEAMTQKELANILGIDRGCYSHYESEDVIIPLAHLVKICDFFKVSVDYIFNFVKTSTYFNSSSIDSKITGNLLKLERKNLKLNQADLAKKMGASKSIISDYESGKVLPSTKFLYNFCREYNISADYLLGKTNEPKYLK